LEPKKVENYVAVNFAFVLGAGMRTWGKTKRWPEKSEAGEYYREVS
jgi:hypothetical protein